MGNRNSIGTDTVNKILELRNEGKGYKVISSLLNISRDSVRYYCKMNNLGGTIGKIAAPETLHKEKSISQCDECNKNILYTKGSRPRKFCDINCRVKNNKKPKQCICSVCQKYFESNRKMKYCSDVCRNSGNKKTKRKTVTYTKECKYCKKTFPINKKSQLKRTYCSKECHDDYRRISHSEYVIKFKAVYENEFELYSEYKGAGFPIKIKCLKCKEIITKHRASNLINFSRKYSCQKCHPKSLSVGEENIKKWLEVNDFSYIKEDPLVLNNKRLRFDFAIYDSDKLTHIIEFDGVQHFPNYNGRYGDEDRVENDMLKNEYCIKNRIPMIRIPYWEIDEIDNILHSFLIFPKFLVNNPIWSHDKYLEQQKNIS